MSTIDHLVYALRADTTPAAWRARLSQPGVDQDDLAVTALALGLAPWLHYQLEGWDLPLPEARAQAKLAFARQAEAARHAARRAQLAEVLSRLPASPIVLKGAYLAEHVYPVPGLRPMNDIDLLFRESDLAAAGDVLRGLGYGAKEKSPELGPGITKHTSTFKRAGAAVTPNPYLSGNGAVMIEPHRSLEESWFGLKCNMTPGMWERSRVLDVAGQPARALSPEDNLLHLCVHLAFHLVMGSPSFVQLLDLSVFTRTQPVDWGALVARAGELRASGYVLAAATLAQRALSAPFPAEVLRSLAAASPARLRRRAAALSLAEVMRRTQQPPLRTLTQRLRRGVADRAETAAWAHSLGEWLSIWWTLVDFRRTDTWRMVFGG